MMDFLTHLKQTMSDVHNVQQVSFKAGYEAGWIAAMEKAKEIIKSTAPIHVHLWSGADDEAFCVGCFKKRRDE